MIVQSPFAQLKVQDLLLDLAFIFITVYVICILIASTIFSNFDSDDSIASYISYILFLLISCFWLHQKLYQNQIDLKSIFGKFFIDYRLLIRLFLLTVVWLLFSLGVIFVTFALIPLILPSSMKFLSEYLGSTESQAVPMPLYSYFWEIFAFVIIGPVAEEFIFRGVLLHVLAAKHKIGLSVLMSSLVFGLLHIHPVITSAKGIFYALLYIKYRSLFVPIFAHAINNAIVTTIPFFLERVINDATDMPTQDEITNLWKIGVPLIAVTAPFIVHFFYKYFPSNKISLPYFFNN